MKNDQINYKLTSTEIIITVYLHKIDHMAPNQVDLKGTTPEAFRYTPKLFQATPSCGGNSHSWNLMTELEEKR